MADTDKIYVVECLNGCLSVEYNAKEMLEHLKRDTCPVCLQNLRVSKKEKMVQCLNCNSENVRIKERHGLNVDPDLEHYYCDACSRMFEHRKEGDNA